MLQNSRTDAPHKQWVRASFTILMIAWAGLLAGCPEEPVPEPEPECRVGMDCPSGVCSAAGTCALPTCVDMVKNGEESGTDCGGSCQKCDTGLECRSPDDCKSGTCTMGVCTEKKGIGELCNSVDECDAQYECRQAGDEQICTQSCAGTCPTGFACFREFCTADTYCDDPDGDGFGAGPGCTGTICDLCDERATCVEEGDFSFNCVCNEGFTGDGFTCGDFDECASGTADCDLNAACENTDGGFECTCADGFSGDGKTCEDIDECATDADDCDERAICTNLEGGFFCSCPPGSRDISGDGTECSDVDECFVEMDNCDEDATCTDIDDGFLCECNEGFIDATPQNPGRQCVDVDECTTGEAQCDPDATCENTDGGYECSCPPDKLDVNGDGTVCAEEDNCAPFPAGCDQLSVCRNSPAAPNGYICVCPPGYQDANGDGSSCVEIDECAAEIDVCDDLASCQNTPGSYTCTCPAGYFDERGDGTVCLNINECADGTDNCSDDATCTDTPGAFTCQCLPGFIGDGVNCRRPTSCLDLLTDQPMTTSGIHTIDTGMSGEIDVYCDMNTEGGGWTFLKVDKGSQSSAMVAESHCSGLGMQLFIPRTKAHRDLALTLANNANIGPGGSANYMRILGIYPDSNGATCLSRSFASTTPGCNWGASDGGGFFVSARADITEPNGDNDTRASMYYSWMGNEVDRYNDIPFPGYTSRFFMCDTGDKK